MRQNVKTGGDFVHDLQNLAVPFAILLAKQGMDHMYAKQNKYVDPNKPKKTIVETKVQTKAKKQKQNLIKEEVAKPEPKKTKKQRGGMIVVDSEHVASEQKGGCGCSKRNAKIGGKMRQLAGALDNFLRVNSK